jgi:hypothetical protein
VDPSGIGALTLLTVASVPGLYSGILPDHLTIGEAAVDAGRAEAARDVVHRGMRQATGLSVLLGLGTSIIAKKPWPLLGVLLICGWMLWQYERYLRPACVTAEC